MKLNDYIGNAVKIVGKHPDSGKTGLAVRVETLPMMRQEGLLIGFDDGTGSYVFDEKNLRLLKEEQK